jgi:hypothetical protein
MRLAGITRLIAQAVNKLFTGLHTILAIAFGARSIVAEIFRCKKKDSNNRIFPAQNRSQKDGATLADRPDRNARISYAS